DLARDSTAARVVGVVCFDLSNELRRVDSGARSKRSAACAAAGSRSDASAVASTETGSGPRSRAAAFSGTVTVGFGLRLLQPADSVAIVGRRRDDRRNDDRQRF